MDISELTNYCLVDEMQVRDEPGFVPVERWGKHADEIEDGCIGFNRRLRFIQFPIELLNELADDYLINRIKELEQEAEELRCDLATAHDEVHWWAKYATED